MQQKVDAVSDVDIDKSGRFKYVLIKLYYGNEDKFKYLVRGYIWAEYHMDIYENTAGKVLPLDFATECVGGGRILHEPEKKSIQVYGYSQGYGRADHQITVDILKKSFPEYTSITFSNEGY